MRLLLTVLALGGCGDLVGFGGDVPPLARISVQTTGNQPATHLRIGLVWGAQQLPEPFCFLPAESDAAAAVIAAGCSDPLRFVPAQMEASVEVSPGVPGEIDLLTLPTADLMVGDVSARVAYASLVAYDDRDDSGTLELHDAQHDDPEEFFNLPPPEAGDVVLGASFVSMTQPDVRIAFREGAFVSTGFYPRAGCDGPPKFFSILGAGGFSAADAFAASLRGELPQEDPATCRTGALEDTTVSVPLGTSAGLAQLACREDPDGTRYHEPPTNPSEVPDLTGLVFACAKLPSFGEVDPTDVAANQLQLVIANPPGDPCAGMFHFVLRGCDRDPTCSDPEWNWIDVPPSWWPCPG